MNRKTIQLALAALLAATLIPSIPLAAEDDHESHGAEEEEHAEEGPHDEHGDEDVVQLSDDVAKEFGIEVGIAGSGLVARTVVLPAEVRPNEEKLAHIAPRFPGIARDVKKRIGDVVKAGETLAVIESSESLAPYSLKTQIDGVIVERHITRGEPVSQSRGRVFTVADLSDVWVDISVYQKHLRDVKLGQ